MSQSLFVFFVIAIIIVLITFYLIFCESTFEKYFSKFEDSYKWKVILFAVFCIIVLAFISICFHDEYLKFSFKIDPELASKLGAFVGGVFGPLFSIITIICIAYQLFLQENARTKDNLNREISEYKKDITDKFYKHLDIHMHDLFVLKVRNVKADRLKEKCEGRRAFVVFRMQINMIISLFSHYYKSKKDKHIGNVLLFNKNMIRIYYAVFYYGYGYGWFDFVKLKIDEELLGTNIIELEKIMNILKKVKFKKQVHIDSSCMTKGINKDGNKELNAITRTNLTSVSSYFENIFYAINLVDKAHDFDLNEKRNLVDMFICQLSEPEKFVFFFYLVSSFGEKWEKEDLLKYNLLAGLTKDYCFGYDPNTLLRQGITSRDYSRTS